jgi:hypothetical protein
MGVKKLIDKLDVNSSHRLVLNNLIVLFNVFGSNATELILFKIPEEQYPVLFVFLLYIHRLPDEIINRYDVELDLKTIEHIRKF